VAGWFGLVRFGLGFLVGWVVGLHGGVMEAVRRCDLFDSGISSGVLMERCLGVLLSLAVIVDCACWDMGCDERCILSFLS